MKKLKYYLLAFCLLGGILADGSLSAQEPTNPNTPTNPNRVADTTAGAAQPKADEPQSKYKPVPKGIRFVFKDVPAGVKKAIYMPVNNKEGVEIDVMVGLLTKRVPFPQGGRVDLYVDPPAGGKYEGRKLLSAPLPNGNLDKLIGVIVPSGNEAGVFFLNESDLAPGTVCMKNLTNQPVRVSINDQDFFNFKPGEEKVYGSVSPSGKSVMYAAKMYFQDKNEKWYVGRQFAMKSRQKDAELHLFIWNPNIQKVDLQKIVVAPEYDRTPKPITPKDRLPRPPRGGFKDKDGKIPWDSMP